VLYLAREKSCSYFKNRFDPKARRMPEERSLKLPRDFYAQPVLDVARQCIGKLLVSRTAEGEAAGRIVEAEAYRGPHDLAAHSARGLTKRTAAMFGPPGYAYIYLLYGVSWALNLVAASEGEPHAVLIRALEPARGLELMAQRRGKPAASRELTNGPGKLTQALAITGALYGADLCGDQLFLEEPERSPGPIARSRRINVEYAGQWADKLWRFYERGNRFVSVPPRE
jgi:DNA-3-methyladenine glycosylase